MKRLLPYVGLAFALLWSTGAQAYCRTTTCLQKNPPPECQPIPKGDECQKAGKPLYWGQRCISFSVNNKGSLAQLISADALQGVVEKSYANWQSVECPAGGAPNIQVWTYPQVDCDEVRYNKTDVNQNLWVFRDESWPHDDPTNSMIALTSVIFNPNTGEIYDADVELNSWGFDFSLESTGGETDLQSVVQHESGHVLGLAHSSTADATMWTRYDGMSDMRTLETDDAAGLCAVYPPDPDPAQACNAEPRHGFALECTAPPDNGCSIGTGAQRSGASLALGGLALLGLSMRRRRSGACSRRG